MDHRTALKNHAVLDFEGMSCHIEEVVGQGSNAIVYKGWYRDNLNQELRHQVLVKELFPFHPQGKIWRAEGDRIAVAPEAEELWKIHRESFEVGNEVHLRLLHAHPGEMVMNANLNSFRRNGTLYSVLGYTGGRSLQEELRKGVPSLRSTAQRMIWLLDALEAFHESGYLHLDISPDNIMLLGEGNRERIFLIDYNSAQPIGQQGSRYLSCKAGYSAPEVNTGNWHAIGVSSDLYSVAAVFYRCIMGRSLTLPEILQSRVPDGQDSPVLQKLPQTAACMVRTILRKGLHTLARKRYQNIEQMRQAFQELLDRIDCVGVTHWSLWENGKRSVEEMIRANPSLRYLREPDGLYPIRLEQGQSLSLEQYVTRLLSPEGRSGLLLAQGGMGKTTLLLHTAMLQSKQYAPTVPAIFYISLSGWGKADTQFIRTQLLMRMRFKKEENTFESALHALHQLLEQPLKMSAGEAPAVLLLLDGLNETRGDIAPLAQEIRLLSAMAGVRILAASRSEVPELQLEAVRLLPLHREDIEEALGRNGLFIPQNQEVMQLLCTPLILSIYIQANAGAQQREIQNEDELMQAYLASLLEKELAQLPEDSPERWQVDAALNYVLPAIAIEAKRGNSTLSQEQLLAVVARCWQTLRSRKFQKTFPQWIGHGADIRADAQDAEEWFGTVIHGILWQRLGMLIRDADTDGYRIFHQIVAEYLAEYKIPLVHRKKRLGILAAVLLCAVICVGYQQYSAAQEALIQRQTAEAEIKSALELGACGYSEYGNLYRKLRTVLDAAMAADTQEFQDSYENVLKVLKAEQGQTASEETEARRVLRSSVYDQQTIPWGTQETVYEYPVLSELFYFPEERADFYVERMPLLKIWMESETIRERTPDFADVFSNLLEADADLAAEMYHRAVGMHLSGTDAVWLNNLNSMIAMIPELDSHRDTEIRDDRGQMLSSRKSEYLTALGEFERVYSRVSANADRLSKAK